MAEIVGQESSLVSYEKQSLLKVARGAFHRHDTQNCQEKNLNGCKKFCAGNVGSVHNPVHCSSKNSLFKLKSTYAQLWIIFRHGVLTDREG